MNLAAVIPASLRFVPIGIQFFERKPSTFGVRATGPIAVPIYRRST
jgi:hypothetical protein